MGQGLSVVIIKQNQGMVYDTGARYPSGFNMADSVIVPYLRYQHLNQINRLVLSHEDNDHAGALKSLQAALPVDTLISSKTACFAGQYFIWQGLSVRPLWPLERVPLSQRVGNDQSCVLMISDGRFRVLLTGDISQDVERRLVVLYGKALKADLLLAPHHGSNGSSSQVFLNQVSPQWVVFSQGQGNRWSFPRKEVLKRVQKVGAHFLCTSVSGQITFLFEGKVMKSRVFRPYNGDVWYHQSLFGHECLAEP